MLRILHCIHSLNPKGGGPADFVHQCASLQQDHQIEIEVVCLDAPNSPWLSNFPAKVHAVGPGIGHYGFCPALVQWIDRNAVNYDIMVIDGIWQFSSFGTWLGLRKHRTPYVVFTDGMLDPWFNQRYPLKAMKKWPYWLLAERKVLRDAAAVFFTAEEERTRAACSFRPYEANGVVVPYGTIPPPDATSRYRTQFQQRFPHLDGKVVFVFLGRIHPKKGCDLLLHAFNNVRQLHPQAHVLLVGPGEPEFEKTLAAIDVPDGFVTRIGMVHGEEKWSLLAGADAMILPSHQENFARVVAEALSCSTPVLLSHRVNIWSAIVNSRAGFAAANSTEGTEFMLREFLELSAEQRASMRQHAHRCYEENFNALTNFPKYLQVLRSIAG